MSVSKTTIFNKAASHLGVKPVAVDTEQTVVALQMARVYDTARQTALRAIAPGFATVIQTLSEVADYTPPPGWTYGYGMPALQLEIVRVYNGLSVGVSFDSNGRPVLDDPVNVGSPVQYPPFRKIFDATLAINVILSNVPDAYAEWIYDMTDTTKFDASFVEGLALCLAAQCCVALTGDKDLAARLAAAFSAQYSETSRIDASETKNESGGGSIVDSRG